ncbi:hypothetical protein Pcaca05_11290 [Pectobacterium carotovorum subsp. carotovorum]|nr:hypothetical protein Pcaca05_11290 [Pectobacterium carotovorum subsp. carotovorum]
MKKILIIVPDGSMLFEAAGVADIPHVRRVATHLATEDSEISKSAWN